MRTYHSQSGFTLIELLITTAISAVLLLGISSVFMVTLLGNARSTMRQQLSDEGTFALEQMKFMFRNAAGLGTGQQCGNGFDNTSFILSNEDGSEVRFSLNSGRLHVQRKASPAEQFPAVGNDTALTSEAVVASSLVFECEVLAAAALRSVNVSFTLAKSADSVSLTQDFSALIQMRN